MQACKRNLFAFTLAALCLTGSFAQTSFTSPSMPSVSVPEIGGGFYNPGKSSFYTPLHDNDKKTAEKKQEPKADDNTAIKTSVDNSILTTLTSAEISSLNNMGLLNNLNFNSTANQGDAQTKVLLTKVLSELEEIRQNIEKKEGNKTSAKTVSYSVEKEPKVVLNPKFYPRLLKFSVNNYNILKTCTHVFISKVAQNGTFLITGDRRYTSDGKTRTETFHILFTISEERTKEANYTAAASVKQDYENKYSFLYQLAQKNELKAIRVGNFVSMRSNDSDWNLEFLVDLGDE